MGPAAAVDPVRILEVEIFLDAAVQALSRRHADSWRIRHISAATEYRRVGSVLRGRLSEGHLVLLPRAGLALVHGQTLLRGPALIPVQVSVRRDVTRKGLLGEHPPALPLKVEDVQVVQLVGDLVESAKYDHVIPNDVARVPCSPHRNEAGRLLPWVLVRRHFGPLVRAQVESPQIVQLFVIVVPSPKYVHLALIDASGMAVPRRGLIVVQEVAAVVDDELEIRMPCLVQKVVNVDFICSRALCETSEDVHRLMLLRRDCGMAVPGLDH